MRKVSGRLVSCLLALSLLPGCALWNRRGEKRHAAEEARLREKQRTPELIGTITLVNEDERFVLIDNDARPGPSLGSVVKSRTGDVESGELRLTEIRKRPFIIADIVKGTPQKGDRVFQNFP
jgi:hypothetical protein